MKFVYEPDLFIQPNQTQGHEKLIPQLWAFNNHPSANICLRKLTKPNEIIFFNRPYTKTSRIITSLLKIYKIIYTLKYIKDMRLRSKTRQ